MVADAVTDVFAADEQQLAGMKAWFFKENIRINEEKAAIEHEKERMAKENELFEKKLEILKDPHTGAFAIISLCCYFLLCVGIFSEMRTERLFAAALVFVFSRSLSGISVVTFPAAKNSGLLRTFQDGAQKRNVRIVLIFWLLAAGVGFYLTAGLCGVAAAVVGLAVFFYYYQFSRKQFGGITGDLAGYFLQLCELFMLAVLALF